MSRPDDAAHARTLKRVAKAVAMHEKAVKLLREALEHEDVPYSCGESPEVALCLNCRDAEWIAKRCFGR